MSETVKALQEILTEMFGPDRMMQVPPKADNYFGRLGATQSDRADFRGFVEEKFGVTLYPYLISSSSLTELAAWIDTAQANTNPH